MHVLEFFAPEELRQEVEAAVQASLDSKRQTKEPKRQINETNVPLLVNPLPLESPSL
jgi:hypothetical protein